MNPTFKEILTEYYSLYRGQGTSVPAYGRDREYATAVNAANNAIRKWSRADNIIWKELVTTAVINGSTITIASSTYSYDCPTNMDSYGAFIAIIDGNNTQYVQVIEPHQLLDDTQGDYACFFGDPNNGYSLKLSSQLVANNIGRTIDFVYIKKPTLLPTDATADNILVEMSDVNYLIQAMLRSRYTTAKNGFGVSIANKDADDALINMKTRNNMGFYGRQDKIQGGNLSWGTFIAGGI